jgi:DNA-binding response OmpR family regulator
VCAPRSFYPITRLQTNYVNKATYLFLIEDDKDDVMLFRDAAYYADPKVRIDHAPSCPVAIEMLEDNLVLPDMIVLDYNLPGINGKECLKKLRSLAHLKDVPVIFFSTTDNPFTKDEMKKSGAVDFVTKPPRFADLVKFVSNLVKGVSTSF